MRKLAVRLGLGNDGDTIVEVLISIAIVSLVLTVSYATASHNLRSIQDAQERSQALQLAQSQVEYLRNTQPGSWTPGNCFTSGGVVSSGSDCTVDSDNNKINPDQPVQPQYVLTINKSDADKTYTVAVQWDSLISSVNKDNLTLYYRP